jgi:hypothetical protein
MFSLGNRLRENVGIRHSYRDCASVEELTNEVSSADQPHIPITGGRSDRRQRLADRPVTQPRCSRRFRCNRGDNSG